MVNDFNFVTRRVADGGAITNKKALKAVEDAGITMVIDAREDYDSNGLFVNPPVSYFHNPAPDDGRTKPVEWFYAAIHAAIVHLEGPNTKVLFHCAAGVERGPSLCYAFLRAQGLDPNLAENLIRQARPFVPIAYKRDAEDAIYALGYDDFPRGPIGS